MTVSLLSIYYKVTKFLYNEDIRLIMEFLTYRIWPLIIDCIMSRTYCICGLIISLIVEIVILIKKDPNS